MEHKNNLPVILSVIAIVLSVIAIYSVLRINNSIGSNNYVTATTFNAEHGFVSSVYLERNDFFSFQNKVDTYNKCINNVEKEYAYCVELNSSNSQCPAALNMDVANCGTVSLS